MVYNNNYFYYVKPTETTAKSKQTSQPNRQNGNANKVKNDQNKNKKQTKQVNTTINNNNGSRNVPVIKPNNSNDSNLPNAIPNNINQSSQYMTTTIPSTSVYSYAAETVMGEDVNFDTNDNRFNNTNSNNNNSIDDNHLQTIVIILGIVIITIFSLTLVRLKNRSNDKKPIVEKSLYDRNKPLPSISPSQLMKHSQLNKQNQQMSGLQIQQTADMSYNQINMNNNYMNPNMNQNVVEYDLQQQQQQYGYDDNRISFLALGDSAIEPRQATLSLKEDVIKKSKDNLPIPLVHINNKNAPNSNVESYGNNDIDEDDINLKAVEPLPGTIIPSKRSPQNTFANSRLLQESHGLFKKVSKSVKNVGNRLKPNSIMSTMSNSSKSSNEVNNSSAGRYSVLSSPKE